MTELIEGELPRLPARDASGHKGTFGRVAVIGGCAAGQSRMIGAPALVARGTLRAGAGLVKLVCPGPVLDTAISIEPSATGIVLPTDKSGEIVAHEAAAIVDRVLEEADVIVVGPGLGISEGAAAVSLRVVQQEDVPVIVDADALNNLARTPELHLDFRAPAVLTPHPGEYARLAASLRIEHGSSKDSDRVPAAAELARRLGSIVVLKGAGTVVSDGQRAWVCRERSAVLATAGTGDVLAGVIAGIIGQHLKPLSRFTKPTAMQTLDLFDAARVGVDVHARAARAWSEQHHSITGGILSRELADFTASELQLYRDNPPG